MSSNDNEVNNYHQFKASGQQFEVSLRKSKLNIN